MTVDTIWDEPAEANIRHSTEELMHQLALLVCVGGKKWGAPVFLALLQSRGFVDNFLCHYWYQIR